MTFKNAVAGLPLGGGKGVIMLRAASRSRRARAGRALRGLRRHRRRRSAARTSPPRTSGRRPPTWRSSPSATAHVNGLARERGGSGDPSPYTALGVVTAIEVCCERVFGTPTLAGRSVALAGLGHVGAPRRPAARRGRARRSSSPTSTSASAALADELGARWVTPEEALTARGRRLRAVRARRRAQPRDRPRACARRSSPARRTTSSPTTGSPTCSSDRGILWAPDFVANAGGIMNIAVELEPGGYDPVRAEERVRGIGDTLRAVFDDADAPDDAAQRGDGAARGATWRAERSGPEPVAARADPRARAAPSGAAGRSTPSGSRPSSSSFSRCAPSVAAAARRSAVRRVVPGRVEHLVDVRAPAVERLEQPPLAVEAVRDVLVELRRRVLDHRAVAGAQQLEVAARAARASASRYSPSCADDEHRALAEHGVAGERDRAGDERDVVGRVARASRRLQRPEPVAVAEHVGVPRAAPTGAPGAARPRTASAWSAWSWVSAIPPAPPRRSASATTAVDVLVERRARVDDPARVAPDEPRVRAAQRERARVVGADQRDVVRLEASPLGEAVDRRRRARRRRRGRGRPRRTTRRCRPRGTSSARSPSRAAGAQPRGADAAVAEVAVDVAAAQRRAGRGRGRRSRR